MAKHGGITDEELEELVSSQGRGNVDRALKTFLRDGVAGPLKVSPSLSSFLLDEENDLFSSEDAFGSTGRPTFDEINETAAVIAGRRSGANDISNEQARVLSLAALKPQPGLEQADRAQRRSTQRQRAARAGASQTIGTTPQGLFDPAHLARRKLTQDPFFRGGLS